MVEVGQKAGCWAAEDGHRSWTPSLHPVLTLFTSAENLDETREQKEKCLSGQSALPSTPPSTPVKLEEGECCWETWRQPCCETMHGLCALVMECGDHSIIPRMKKCVFQKTSATHSSGNLSCFFCTCFVLGNLSQDRFELLWLGEGRLQGVPPPSCHVIFVLCLHTSSIDRSLMTLWCLQLCEDRRTLDLLH